MEGELEGKVAVVTEVVSGTRREGGLKEQLLRKASQLQTASQISLWLSSPDLPPPTQRTNLAIPALTGMARFFLVVIVVGTVVLIGAFVFVAFTL